MLAEDNLSRLNINIPCLTPSSKQGLKYLNHNLEIEMAVKNNLFGKPTRRLDLKATTKQTVQYLDWIFMLSSCWLIGGLYLDGWAHLHFPELETFFTPWHGVLYSGFLVNAIGLLTALIGLHVQGRP